MDVGKVAPTPNPENLLRLGRSPPTTPNNNNDSSDGDHYPEYRGYVPPKRSPTVIPNDLDKSTTTEPAAQASTSEPIALTLNEPIESAMITPAAQILVPEPAAIGATTRTKPSMMETTNHPHTPLIPRSNQVQSEDEVSLGDDPEPMGPQIPIPTTDTDFRMGDTTIKDPLEFASSYLMLYGIPTSEDFTAVQNLVTTIVSRLDLTVRRLFRVNAEQSHSFWFEMASLEQAQLMRTYMHHRRENDLELLVSYANYDDYIKALT